MRRPYELEQEQEAMATLVELTSAFEGTASMQISKIKSQVTAANKFFNELWQIYSQLRVDQLFHYGRSQDDTISQKELYIIITAEGGFSGDIDQKLIKLMLKGYDKDKQDIIVIGHHGAVQLAQQGIAFKKYFKLPVKDQNINVTPIVKEVQAYTSTTVFYQQYISLMVQDVKRISISAAVQELSKSSSKSTDIISESNYIFEPDTYAVIGHLERSMLQISISQLILDSKLAQHASRFRAMSGARKRAGEARSDLTLAYYRAKRSTKDERLKETINGLKKLKEHV